MKKHSQVVLGWAIKTSILGIAYLYLWIGDNGAGNILKFYLALTFSANALLAVVKDARLGMRKKGRDLPAWTGHLFGAVLATALVYHGHFIYATMAIMTPIFSDVIYGSNPKEASNANV